MEDPLDVDYLNSFMDGMEAVVKVRRTGTGMTEVTTVVGKIRPPCGRADALEVSRLMRNSMLKPVLVGLFRDGRISGFITVRRRKVPDVVLWRSPCEGRLVHESCITLPNGSDEVNVLQIGGSVHTVLVKIAEKLKEGKDVGIDT